MQLYALLITDFVVSLSIAFLLGVCLIEILRPILENLTGIETHILRYIKNRSGFNYRRNTIGGFNGPVTFVENLHSVVKRNMLENYLSTASACNVYL